MIPQQLLDAEKAIIAEFGSLDQALEILENEVAKKADY